MMSTRSGRRPTRTQGKALAAVAAAVVVLGGLLTVQSISQAATLNSNALFVSPSGSDSAAGTEAQPTTLASAITRITAGGTIYLRGGKYSLSQLITIAPGNDGTASARKELSAYPGETPVLNFAAMPEAPANRGLTVNGKFWRVYGIVVEHAGDNGIFVGGSNNIFERTVTRFNRDSGLQISRMASTTPRDQWPANNLVLSAESHDNRDSDGEDADGFAAKLTTGPGNVFRYAVSHHNVDDGWDLFTKPDTGPIDPVTIEDSLAYDNGTLSDGTQATAGDRNGYKLGGDDIPVNHIVRRSIAYHNGKHGFTYNSNPGKMSISDNVSVNNAQRNFSFDAGTSVFRNNTSCRSGSGSNDRTIGDVDASNQFWTGTNGSRCASYAGALGWSFAADGRLVVTFGGRPTTPSPTVSPIQSPTSSPIASPTVSPTRSPIASPTVSPTRSPIASPTLSPTRSPSASPGGAGCRVTYTVSAWNTGLTTEVTIANTSSTAINGWSLVFTLPSGQTISSGWSATYSPTSGQVTARNVTYNGSIAPNSSVSIGFQASHTGNAGKPTAFTLNGSACSVA